VATVAGANASLSVFIRVHPWSNAVLGFKKLGLGGSTGPTKDGRFGGSFTPPLGRGKDLPQGGLQLHDGAGLAQEKINI
jgi:hypothetical protein